jgi:hypothetical protein
MWWSLSGWTKDRNERMLFSDSVGEQEWFRLKLFGGGDLIHIKEVEGSPWAVLDTNQQVSRIYVRITSQQRDKLRNLTKEEETT